MKSAEPKVSKVPSRQQALQESTFFAKNGEAAGLANETAHSFIQPKTPPPFFADGGGRVQPKLKVHPAGDTYEREADSVADRVVHQLHAPPSVQRQAMGEEEIQEMRLSSGITPLQMQRPFESPTLLEQNSAHGPAQEEPLQRQADRPAAPDNVVHVMNAPPPVQRYENDDQQAVQEHNETSSLQMQRAFESPTAMERNSANEPAEETMSLQKRSESEEVQTAAEQGEETGGGLQHQLSRSKGGGSSLPDETRSKMESGFGADFSGVHVHNDSQAENMNRQLGARAFTHGNDIYFNRGEYRPATPAGDHLLAHELTHTVQQGAAKSSVQRSTASDIIQRAGEGEEEGSTKVYEGPEGQVDIRPSPKKVLIKKLLIPNVKLIFTPNALTTPLRTGDRPTDQSTKWKQNEGAATPAIKAKIEAAGNIPNGGRRIENGVTTYFFKLKGGANQYVIGTSQEIVKKLIIPTWTKKGEPTTFDVDHKKEWQFGGEHELSNFWLLESSANRSAGSKISKEIDNRIRDLVGAASKGAQKVWKKQPTAKYVKDNYEITIMQIDAGLSIAGKPDQVYNDTEIFHDATPLQGLNPMTEQEIHNLEGSASELSIIAGDRSSAVKKVKNPFTGTIPNWFNGFDLLAMNDVQLNAAPGAVLAKLSGSLLKKQKKQQVDVAKNIDIPVIKMAGLPFTGKIDTSGLLGGLKGAFSFPGLSPIQIDEAYLDGNKGFILIGKILPTIPMFKKADIDLLIEGDDLSLRKLFKADEISVPPPFKIIEASLEISVGTKGFGADGRIDFEIQRLGQGFIGAGASTKQGIYLEGEFNFDSKTFDPARIKASYIDGKFAAEGEIGIPKERIKGLKGAKAKISYASDDLVISGAAQLDIPGLKQSDLTINYEKGELTLTGALELGKKIPGIKSASGQVEAKQGTDGEWKVKASGTAEPDIPGVSSTLNIAYDDGILDMSAIAAFDKGLASGNIEVGATNRAIGPDGNPGGKATENITIYGGGSVGIKITPWLKATVGVRLLPNGEIEVLGRIELPSTVDVFARKEIDKKLFTLPTIEIPIFAIPLGPKSLGLVAQINGGLDFNAGIGPGQIQGLFGEIKYNPSHPEQTTLTGGGRFVIPADAGLKLHADLSLGLSAAIASLTGGIEMTASVGLKGEASAAVDLNWNPTSGLELNAVGEVKVSPRFKFDLNLLARAKLDLYVTELSKEWRYNLASYEWGPGFDFGLKFPIHYKEGKPFDISFEDIEVIKPDIDILSTAKGIAKDIKDKVF